MKLIIKLSLVALSLASLAGCSKQAQPKPPNKEITTVKVINQPVSLKKKNIVRLIKYHAEKNETGFRNEAYEIAKDFDANGV